MALNKTLFLCITLLFTSTIFAQDQSNTESNVEKSVLNYIENFFENNFDAMNSSLHPRLAKRGLNPNGSLSDDYPPQKLKELMESKKALPLSAQNNTVKDIVIYGNMARATLTTGYPNMRWVEYIHLVKEDNNWKIINLFWEYSPKE